MSTQTQTREGSGLALGYFFAAAGAILFSIKAIIVKLAYALGVDPETLLALRLGLSLPFYLGIGAYSLFQRAKKGLNPPKPAQWLRSAFIGMLGMYVASYTDFLGLLYIGAQFERLILLTYPFFVVFFGAMFFGQEIKRRAVIALLIAYTGLSLIFGESVTLDGHDAAIGALWVFAAAVSFALFQLLAHDAIGELGPRLFTCIAMTGAAAAGFAQFFLGHGLGDLVVTPTVFAYALLVAIGATVLPTFFMSAALHRISAQANATIGILSPVSTIVLAAIVLGERMSAMSIAGTILVIAGVGWFTLSGKD